MPNPVTHFEIQSADAEKTQAFFQDVFGWQLNVIPAMGYALVDTQTGSGIGGGIGGSEDGQSHVTFYIEVPRPGLESEAESEAPRTASLTSPST